MLFELVIFLLELDRGFTEFEGELSELYELREALYISLVDS